MITDKLIIRQVTVRAGRDSEKEREGRMIELNRRLRGEYVPPRGDTSASPVDQKQTTR